MQRNTKAFLGLLVAIPIALGVGWIWGASGRFALQSTLNDTELRLELAEARELILQARVDLYNLNFGEASRHLESSKMPLNGVAARFDRVGRDDSVKAARAALASVEEAQRLAGKLDQASNGAAAAAIKALNQISERP